MARMVSTAEVYSDGDKANLLEEGLDEDSIAGIMVSPMARRVVHCSGVKISPSGGGGRGLARGDIKFNSWILMMALRRAPSEIVKGRSNSP